MSRDHERSARPPGRRLASASPAPRRNWLSAGLRRLGYGLDLALFMAALLTIAVVLSVFAQRPAARFKIDATKTRAYSLSEQTRAILDRLDGAWTIALIMVEDLVDEATLHQIDEVLDRYEDAASDLSIVRIDPTDPASLPRYEALLTQLHALEATQVAAYETALDDGVRAFEDLQRFARLQSARLEETLAALDANDPLRQEAQERLGLLGLLAREGGQVLTAIRQSRAVRDEQPIPDYESARSILAQALSQWANELYEMGARFDAWSASGNEILGAHAAAVKPAYRSTSQRLAIAAEPLISLPPLEIATIGQQLAQGETAVVVGPDRAVVIPSPQILPKLNVRDIGDGVVAFDQRFRGEQVISAAMRSLLVPQMPRVVFVHGNAESLLRSNEQHADLLGVATLLAASRYEVKEWQIGAGERPVVADGQPVVWIVLPPSRRQGLQLETNELLLIRTTQTLIAEGEAVMLNVYPSLLPRYRQSDPWAALALPLNLEPDTAHAIFEAVPTAEGGFAYKHGQNVHQFAREHPIGAAAHGQQAFFPVPCPIRIPDETRFDVRHTIIASVTPSPRRWLEPDWASRMSATAEAERRDPFEDAQPLVVAAERRSPIGGSDQRFVLCASGGWLMSYAADAVRAIGGDRVVLTNPGNQELLLASVAWLAGMDDLIAPGPVSRQVVRLDGIDPGVSWRWGLLTVVGLPGLCLAIGLLVGLVRRI